MSNITIDGSTFPSPEIIINGTDMIVDGKGVWNVTVHPIVVEKTAEITWQHELQIIVAFMTASMMISFMWLYVKPKIHELLNELDDRTTIEKSGEKQTIFSIIQSIIRRWRSREDA